MRVPKRYKVQEGDARMITSAAVFVGTKKIIIIEPP